MSMFDMMAQLQGALEFFQDDAKREEILQRFTGPLNAMVETQKRMIDTIARLELQGRLQHAQQVMIIEWLRETDRDVFKDVFEKLPHELAALLIEDDTHGN